MKMLKIEKIKIDNFQVSKSNLELQIVPLLAYFQRLLILRLVNNLKKSSKFYNIYIKIHSKYFMISY